MNIEPKPLHEIISISWILECIKYYRVTHTGSFPEKVHLLTIKQYLKLMTEPMFNHNMFNHNILNLPYGEGNIFRLCDMRLLYDSSRVGWPCQCGELFERHDEISCPHIFYTPIDNLGYCQWLEDQKKKA